MKNIFVSSTFRDMQAERDMIQKEVLPQLRGKARSYGENMNVIDLRWGVDTSELESEEGSMKVMSVCLDEVERSKPYMLIFLGERYGSIIDPAITERVIAHKNSDFKLEDYAISITAMEVEFGMLTEQIDNMENCVVCLRSFQAKSITDEAERATYSAENEELARKQQIFKEKVMKKVQGRVIEYTCDWEEEKKQLTNFRTLEGELLSEKLIHTYEKMFQKEWEAYSRLSWEEKEQRAVDAVIENKLRTFSGRKNLINDYYEKVIRENGVLILQGEVGSGKTSIMCKLIEQLEQNGKRVFRFIAGNSSMSETAVQLVQQMVYYLENLLHVSHYEEAPEVKYGDWLNRLKELTESLQNEETIYFVIDALDQMHQDESVKSLDFLLENKNLRYVLSCTDEFEIGKTKNTLDIVVEKIPHLTVEDARDVIEGILNASSRNVYKDMQDAILTKKSATNPLYISMLIQRLNMMGFDELYSARTENDIILHGMEVIEEVPDGAEEAAVYLLNEAVRRLDEQEKGLNEVVNLIGTSRGGLRERDIQIIALEFEKVISQLDISRLFHYLDTFFMIHEDGRIDFTHKVIRKGIRERLFANAESDRYRKAIATRVKALSNEDDFFKSESMYYASLTGDVAFAEEIFVYANESKDRTVLDAIKAEGLADSGEFYCKNMPQMEKAISFFCVTWNSIFDLRQEEAALREKVCRCFAEWMERREKKTENIEALSIAYNNLGNTLREQGRIKEAFGYYKKVLGILEYLYQVSPGQERLVNLAHAYNNIGLALKQQGEMEEALIYYKNSLQVTEKLYKINPCIQNLRDLLHFNLGIGEVLKEQGKFGEALEYYLRALKAAEEVHKINPSSQSFKDLADSNTCVGEALRGSQNPKEALAYYQKALDIYEERYKAHSDLHSLKDVAYGYNSMANALREQGKLRESLICYEKFAKGCEEIHKASQSLQSLRDLSYSYNNLGASYIQQGEMEDALTYCRKALEVKAEILKSNPNEQGVRDLVYSHYNLRELLPKFSLTEKVLECYKALVYAAEEVYRVKPDVSGLTMLTTSLDDVAYALMEIGEAKEALGYHRRALAGNEELYQKVPDLNHLKLLYADYGCVGYALKMLKELEEAAEYYKKAYEIQEEICKLEPKRENQEELAKCYNRMGHVLSDQKNYWQAMKYYFRAQKLYKNIKK